MDKQEVLTELREGLNGLPQEDIEERLSFYAEMIDDRMEEGLTEQEAVAAIGSVAEVVAQIVGDTPLTKIVREKIKPCRRLGAGEVVLLALGSPIWLSLLISLFAVVLSLYVSLWSVIASVWSVFAALIGSALGTLVGGVLLLCNGNTPGGLACVAGSLVCAGLAIFAFFGCGAATKGVLRLTKASVLAVKKRCVRKEAAE